MQIGAAEETWEAVEAVLAADREGRPAPFELWYATAPRPVSTEAVLQAFVRLNGGREGLRRLTREGRPELYVGQLERTLGARRPARGPPTSIDAERPPPLPDPQPAPTQVEPPPAYVIPRPIRWPAVAASVALAAGACVGISLIMAPESVPEGVTKVAKAPVLVPPPTSPRIATAPHATTPLHRPESPSPRTPPPSPPPPVAASPARTPPLRSAKAPPALTGGKLIRVNMAKRRVYIYEGGKLVRVLDKCSFGRRGHATPQLRNASLSLSRRERLHRSTLYDGAPMPYALFLNESPNVAFHAGSVGERSHGCIHLRRTDAKWLFDWAARDPVRVDIQASAA